MKLIKKNEIARIKIRPFSFIQSQSNIMDDRNRRQDLGCNKVHRDWNHLKIKGDLDKEKMARRDRSWRQLESDCNYLDKGGHDNRR